MEDGIKRNNLDLIRVKGYNLAKVIFEAFILKFFPEW